jgi:hypothetical protein
MTESLGASKRPTALYIIWGILSVESLLPFNIVKVIFRHMSCMTIVKKKSYIILQ